MSKEPVFLAPRGGETDAEQRLREALNGLAVKAVNALDAAIELRTASPETQRARHRARGAIHDAILMMQGVQTLHLHLGPNKTPHKPRS